MHKQEALDVNELNELTLLSSEDIWFILECKKFKEIEQKFSDDKDKAKLAALTAIAKKRSAPVKSSSNKINESLLDALNPISCLVLIMDAFFTLTTAITLASFVVLGSFFAALIVGIGVVHCIGMYRDLKIEDDKKDDKYQLRALQIDCAHVYLNNPQTNIDFEPAEKKPDKKIWQKSKDGIGAMILTASTLFYTYYAVALGLSVALAGSLLVGAMTGPIGLGIALAITFGIGVFLGYKKYQFNKQKELLEKKRKIIENEFDVQRKLCESEKLKLELELELKREPTKAPQNAEWIKSQKNELPYAQTLFPEPSALQQSSSSENILDLLRRDSLP